MLGEHTAEILRELGYDDGGIDALIGGKVVQAADEGATPEVEPAAG
jgi:hypothetical protein